MATTAAPFGALPIRSIAGGGTSEAARRSYAIATTYSTSIFFGDFVKIVGGGGVEKDTGTATMTPIGIFVGCFYTDPTTKQPTHSQYWPASNAATDAVAWVVDDPFCLFEMQADEAVDAADVGQNIPVVQTAGSTAIGRSKNAADGGSHNTTNTLPLRIVSLKDGPFSAAGDAYTDLILTYAAGHQLLNATGV
jgi:hypothetical protein